MAKFVQSRIAEHIYCYPYENVSTEIATQAQSDEQPYMRLYIQKETAQQLEV